ncbi:hypothetical protein D3248_13030 [Leucobacter zeae]|nr:hypothetical protein [Leucobacter zeae]
MAETRASDRPGAGAGLTGRETRRVAELIARGARNREAITRPTRSIPGLSIEDARGIRDGVLRLSGQRVRAVCAAPTGEPILLGADAVAAGSVRVLTAGESLEASIVAGVHGVLDAIVDPELHGAEEHAAVLGIAVFRRPFGDGVDTVEDAVCANGGALAAVTAVLIGHGGAPAELDVVSPSGSRTFVVPPLAELLEAAGETATSALATSSHRPSVADAGRIAVLGSVVASGLPLGSADTIAVSASGTRLLEVAADLGQFI